MTRHEQQIMPADWRFHTESHKKSSFFQGHCVLYQSDSYWVGSTGISEDLLYIQQLQRGPPPDILNADAICPNRACGGGFYEVQGDF